MDKPKSGQFFKNVRTKKVICIWEHLDTDRYVIGPNKIALERDLMNEKKWKRVDSING